MRLNDNIQLLLGGKAQHNVVQNTPQQVNQLSATVQDAYDIANGSDAHSVGEVNELLARVDVCGGYHLNICLRP